MSLVLLDACPQKNQLPSSLINLINFKWSTCTTIPFMHLPSNIEGFCSKLLSVAFMFLLYLLFPVPCFILSVTLSSWMPCHMVN
ncbi:hypothetical protein VIGAN_05160400 [Vigna angularis var. angularis]|uniref:Uncharacterized protein n=1 Tax=Vigna angularis var. angularis TaxID=157739 RepID=A0A0S3S5V4_PHAAN|nr:hypothetical protein VIGAN_05160400 [Vigna angularis var. angularis]